MNLQALPPEIRQFIADVARNAKRYPLEFPPEELEPKRQSSAVARKDPLGSYWHEQLQQIKDQNTLHMATCCMLPILISHSLK